MLQYSSPKSTTNRKNCASSSTPDFAIIEAARAASEASPESIGDEDLIIFYERPGPANQKDPLLIVFGEERIERISRVLQSLPLSKYSLPTHNLVYSTVCWDDVHRLSRHLRIQVMGRRKEGNGWICLLEASPGNQQNILLQDHGDESSSVQIEDGDGSCPVIAAIIVREDRVGMAFAVENRLGLVREFSGPIDGAIESALVQLAVRECLIEEALKNSLKDIADRCHCLLTTAKAASFRLKEELIAANLERLTGTCEQTSGLSLMAMAALLEYLGLLKSESADSSDLPTPSYSLVHQDLGRWLRIDETAIRSLNLFNIGGGVKSSNGSLFAILNRCKTRQGSRLLEQWIRQPLVDLAAITARQDVVEALVAAPGPLKDLYGQALRGCPDLTRTVAQMRLKGKSISLQAMVLVYQMILKIPLVIHILSETNNAAIKERLIDPAEDLLQAGLLKYGGMIEGTVDLAALERHEVLLRPQLDPRLLELDRERQELVEGDLQREYERICAVCRQRGLAKPPKLERSPIYGYHLRVSRLDWGKVEGEDEGKEKDEKFIQLTAQKNGIYFGTPATQLYNQRYDEIDRLYRAQQSLLVAEMGRITIGYKELFDRMNAHVALIDVFASLALVATNAAGPYCRPQMVQECRTLSIDGLRHPCLEDNQQFIPNNVAFNCMDRGSFQILTGPNMGGKSTYIRQTAIAILLAHMGAMIPASSCPAMPLFDAILVRVGAGDCLARGVSTFMGEMLETATIIRTATERSFVVIDELGRGTSTSEGFGIAWAVSKYIVEKIGCIAFFATHFHELTQLAGLIPTKVSNIHVSAELSATNCKMICSNVKPGVCEESFGVQVAEMAGFPPKLIEMARWRLASLEGKRHAFHDPEVAAALSTLTARLRELPSEEERSKLISQVADDPQVPVAIRDIIHRIVEH